MRGKRGALGVYVMAIFYALGHFTTAGGVSEAEKARGRGGDVIVFERTHVAFAVCET
jgi:hypothetical protein